mmetsp:Transcript_8136/g.17681  ORF Transcript_8136/g.17681 Transcript_8136/m.17681 type:complete len:206 (-) Transcript_8136:110-727(-)
MFASDGSSLYVSIYCRRCASSREPSHTLPAESSTSSTGASDGGRCRTKEPPPEDTARCPFPSVLPARWRGVADAPSSPAIFFFFIDFRDALVVAAVVLPPACDRDARGFFVGTDRSRRWCCRPPGVSRLDMSPRALRPVVVIFRVVLVSVSRADSPFIGVLRDRFSLLNLIVLCCCIERAFSSLIGPRWFLGRWNEECIIFTKRN